MDAKTCLKIVFVCCILSEVTTSLTMNTTSSLNDTETGGITTTAKQSMVRKDRVKRAKPPKVPAVTTVAMLTGTSAAIKNISKTTVAPHSTGNVSQVQSKDSTPVSTIALSSEIESTTTTTTFTSMPINNCNTAQPTDEVMTSMSFGGECLKERENNRAGGIKWYNFPVMTTSTECTLNHVAYWETYDNCDYYTCHVNVQMEKCVEVLGPCKFVSKNMNVHIMLRRCSISSLIPGWLCRDWENCLELQGIDNVEVRQVSIEGAYYSLMSDKLVVINPNVVTVEPQPRKEGKCSITINEVDNTTLFIIAAYTGFKCAEVVHNITTNSTLSAGIDTAAKGLDSAAYVFGGIALLSVIGNAVLGRRLGMIKRPATIG